MFFVEAHNFIDAWIQASEFLPVRIECLSLCNASRHSNLWVWILIHSTPSSNLFGTCRFPSRCAFLRRHRRNDCLLLSLCPVSRIWLFLWYPLVFNLLNGRIATSAVHRGINGRIGSRSSWDTAYSIGSNWDLATRWRPKKFFQERTLYVPFWCSHYGVLCIDLALSKKEQLLKILP